MQSHLPILMRYFVQNLFSTKYCYKLYVKPFQLKKAAFNCGAYYTLVPVTVLSLVSTAVVFMT